MSSKSSDLLGKCRAVLGEYSGRITLRQLYYRLVAAQVIENSQASYKRLVALLTRARKAGEFPTDAFCDLTREPVTPGCWADLPSFLEAVGRSYRRDPWQSQERRPEVWVEKEALATVFAPICRRYGVTLQVCRGYPSVTCLVEAAAGTDRILYFGDFDPSGQDIPRSIQEEMRETWGADVSLDLIALTAGQIEEHHLPPAPAKGTDSRTPGFVAAHGAGTVELDALPPEVLEQLIVEAIEREIEDAEAWQDALDQDADERRALAEIIRGGGR
jgi:hypothetical protein